MEIIALLTIVVAAIIMWWRFFPKRDLPKHCAHGVPIRSNCNQCVRDEVSRSAQRRQAGEEALRRAEEEKRRLANQRIQEAENIRQLTYLQKMDPIDFEKVVAEAYRRHGWEVQDTRASGDRGVDAYLRKDGRLSILQCKRLSSKRVGSPVLRDLLGTIIAEEAHGGIIVTTSFFSREATEWIGRAPKPIKLVDGHELLKFIESAYPLGSPVPEDFVTNRRHPLVVPPRCPWCGTRTKRRRGRHGPFYGCMAYPQCQWTMPVPRRG